MNSVLQLRSASSGFCEMVKTAENPVRKQELAARALELAQRAEAIARWQEDPQMLRMSIERYRAMPRAGIDQKQIVERTLHDANQTGSQCQNADTPQVSISPSDQNAPAPCTDFTLTCRQPAGATWVKRRSSRWIAIDRSK